MYKVIGNSEPTEILAGMENCQSAAIPCAPGAGILTIGTVMYRGENGMYSAAGAAEAVSANYLVVLKETVDTGVTGTGVVAGAYLCGELLKKAVHLKDGAELTAANILALRNQGIVLKVDAGAAEFENTVG